MLIESTYIIDLLRHACHLVGFVQRSLLVSQSNQWHLPFIYGLGMEVLLGHLSHLLHSLNLPTPKSKAVNLS